MASQVALFRRRDGLDLRCVSDSSTTGMSKNFGPPTQDVTSHSFVLYLLAPHLAFEGKSSHMILVSLSVRATVPRGAAVTPDGAMPNSEDDPLSVLKAMTGGDRVRLHNQAVYVQHSMIS